MLSHTIRIISVPLPEGGAAYSVSIHDLGMDSVVGIEAANRDAAEQIAVTLWSLMNNGNLALTKASLEA